MLLIITKCTASAKYFWRTWYFFTCILDSCVSQYTILIQLVSVTCWKTVLAFFHTIFGATNDLLPFLALFINKEECFLLFWLKSFCFRVKQMKTQVSLKHRSLTRPFLDTPAVYLRPEHSNLYWCFILSHFCSTVLHHKKIAAGILRKKLFFMCKHVDHNAFNPANIKFHSHISVKVHLAWCLSLGSSILNYLILLQTEDYSSAQ